MGTHFVGKEYEVRALDTFIKLTRASRSVHTVLEYDLAYHHLTENQLGVIEMLQHLGPQCQRAMADKLLTSTGNVTLLVDGLEKRGLVRRQRNIDDRRFITVHLTEAGQALFNTVFYMHVTNVVHAMDGLNPKEQAQLGRLCKKLGVYAQKKHRRIE